MKKWAVMLLALLASGGMNASRQALAEDDIGPLLVRRLPQDQLLIFLDSQQEQQPVKSLADWAKRRQEIIRGMQGVMGVLPDKERDCDLDIQVLSETDMGSYVRRKITYQSEPGSRVPGYLLIPKTALEPDAKPVPAVLALQQTHAQGPDEIVGLGTNVNRRYAKELAERGYIVLAPNYPHLGEYTPDLTGLGYKSGSLKAVYDNKRGLDLLDSLPYVDKQQYAVIGHSLGGHNAVYTAVLDDRLKVVISSCGLDSFLDYRRDLPGVWRKGQGWTQDRYMPALADYAGRLQEIPFDFHELIGALAPRQVLIIAPVSDHNFAADSVDRIVAAAKPVFALHGVPDHLQVEHPVAAHDFPPEMRERAYRLIDSVLRPTMNSTR